MLLLPAAVLACAVALALPTSVAASDVVGTWTRLAPAPVSGDGVLSVWSGKEMLIFGRAHPNPPFSVNMAAAYAPGLDSWRELDPPRGPSGNYEGRYDAVWTGREMLVVGPFAREAYRPATDTWRKLPKTVGGAGIVVWTGRELLGWGGGCCGDAIDTGFAYNPATNTRRELAPSPLAPAQRPLGAWTGRELVLWVSGAKPDGGTWPASLARAAAYNSRSDSWRRIAALPSRIARLPRRSGASTVWTGREVLVIDAGPGRRATYAYRPSANRWRKLAPMPSPHPNGAVVWTGKRLLVWGGGWTRRNGSLAYARRGLAFNPRTNRWSPLPYAPLLGRIGATAVWTGKTMIVWGGTRPASPPQDEWTNLADGAVFTPEKP